MRYYIIKAHIESKLWIFGMKYRLMIWFFKRGIDAIRGKICVIDSREVYSNGGYKYYNMDLSRLPLDKNADYSDL